MKRNFLFGIISIAFIFFTFSAYCQSTSIEFIYDKTSGLSKTKCNVFDPSPVNVGGKLHTSVVGGPSYDDDNGLKLNTIYDYSNDIQYRTAFAISYDFKTNYSYKIEVTVAGDANWGNALVGSHLFETLPSTSNLCGAKNPGVGLYKGLFYFGLTNANTNTYSPPNASFTSNYNYKYILFEASSFGSSNFSSMVYF